MEQTASSPYRPLLAASPMTRGSEVGKRHTARFDVIDVPDEQFIVAHHLLDRLTAHGLGHFVPAVRGALLILCQGLLKPLVLPQGPGGV